VLGEHDDGLRRKLIAIGAQAKHIPEGFLVEAVNALNGWGEERGVWNLSFWDFSVGEIEEEIRVLQNTETLNHIIIDHLDDDRRYDSAIEDASLCRFMMAVVSCQSLERISISGIDFYPRKVWRRIKKLGFLETSWYASALNFTNILESAKKPDIGHYKELLKNLNHFSKKLVIILVTLGNETDGIDLSENGINFNSITALVASLRWPERPEQARPVREVILRNNELDASTAQVLAQTWEPLPANPHHRDALEDESELVDSLHPLSEEDAPGVTAIDVSNNPAIGDKGFTALTAGIAKFKEFKDLKADNIGLGLDGCLSIEVLGQTRLRHLCLSNNTIFSQGVEVVCKAATKCLGLRTLELDNCSINSVGAKALSDLLKTHPGIQHLSLSNNKLNDDGIIELCNGASLSLGCN
ncbi:unnamed protein product, partial [Polarella glacialis]